MKKNHKDYMGTDSKLLGTTRINEKDHEFLVEMATKYSWGKIATMQRMCVKFAKKNQNQFENFLDDMRKPEINLL